MSVQPATVAAFIGIANENEFFSHHYLAEVFRGDVEDTLARWKAEEEAHPGEEAHRAPYSRLRALARDWFATRERLSRERSEAARLQTERELLGRLFAALGYVLQPVLLPSKDWALPALGAFGKPGEPPRLVILHAWDADLEGEDALTLKPHRLLWDADAKPQALHGQSWQEVLSDHLFGADHPPRWVLLAGSTQTLLIDRAKWPQNRLLRFDWSEVLGRRDDPTLKAAAVLLARECLLPAEGEVLLDALDANAHKHAFAVSEDLKYALQEAVQLLGDEAARQLVAQAREQKKGIFSGERELDPAQLTLECLRVMYRLLFLFYIEARPELGYVPIRTSDTYQKGYSLEMLRDLELAPLMSEEARNGLFFDASIRRLFQVIHRGHRAAAQGRLGEIHHSFTILPLDSHLFDPAGTPLLNGVRFPNWVWQRVIQLMSLSRLPSSGRGAGGKGRRRRRGRVSYAQLGINQLGAVYEALLSYRGFFATTDLYEVKKAGENPSVLDAAHFVPTAALEQYTEEERVYDKDKAGHRQLRRYPKGSFIYRLAGRDRQKSASYYTPEVLTQCLVKYALKELLRDKRADDILALTVCEPAMGSAAFLNEAVNQLAEAYLDRKQTELGKRIRHERYALELQRVKMHFADGNVFGVDLNPVAVELAEVSLWLNAISGSDQVPWFGYQLFCGNSLIGARRQVVYTARLKPKAKPAWHETAPRRIDPLAPDRKEREVYHFLLPDPGMASYQDKAARALYPEEFQRLKTWRKQFCQPLDGEEIATLRELSALVDELWALHTEELARDRARTEDWLPVWGQPEPESAGTSGRRSSTRDKDRIRAAGIFNDGSPIASAYRRLKLVMDYWCALWFWPLDQADLLPDRATFWFELSLLLRGNVIETRVQGELDFHSPLPQGEGPGVRGVDRQTSIPEPQHTLPGLEPESPGPAAPATRDITDRFGQLHIEKLFQHFPRLKLVDEIARRRRFFHWELTFADLFASRGGFDLILGNPPWIKVEWNEAGVLSDANPLFALRSFSATRLTREREAAFARYEDLQSAWLDELTEAEATQSFLNGVQNYPLLRGVQTNLYKCFLPQAWMVAAPGGVQGFLHPEGIYDDPKGGLFRAAVYTRLRGHYQITNELLLFAEVDNHTRYSINIYGRPLEAPEFDHIANLFSPATIDACYPHDGQGPVPGIKTDGGKWEIRGHRHRVIVVDETALTTFATLYDDPGTPALQARLPPIHSRDLLAVLSVFEAQHKRLGDLAGSDYCAAPSTFWHESGAQKKGIIERTTTFPEFPIDAIISGPHFFVACPIYKCPHAACISNKDYDVVDLTDTPDNYLQRTNYQRICQASDFRALTPSVPWAADDERLKLSDYYRVIASRSLSPSGERTLQGAILPPGLTHVDSVFSVAFRDEYLVSIVAAFWSSLPFDFYVKATGKSDLRPELASRLPLPDLRNGRGAIVSRCLALNCLTTGYESLWQRSFFHAFTKEFWTKRDPRLPNSFFT